jgi:hypothetical protein
MSRLGCCHYNHVKNKPWGKVRVETDTAELLTVRFKESITLLFLCLGVLKKKYSQRQANTHPQSV